MSKSSFEHFSQRIAASENWLMKRILHYARQQDFTRYTSTLEEAWRMSISGLSASLMKALADGALAEFRPDDDYQQDAAAQFGLVEAQKHRRRGVPLAMFLGLMKYYKQTYKDLVDEGDFNADSRKDYRAVVERFFDRVEIAFCVEWANLSGEKQLAEVQAAARQMTNEKNKYLTLFESLCSPALLVDEQGRIDNMNHAAMPLFGLTLSPGATYYSLAQKQLAPRWLQEHLALLQQQGGRDDIFDIELPVGNRTLWFQVRLQRMFDVSETFSGTVAILTDFTDRLAAEEQAHRLAVAADAANRAKSEFLANMSHEIRTPLTAILGYTDLAITDCDQRDLLLESLDAIRRNGQHLLELINDILDLSKIEADRLEVEARPCCIETVIADVVNMMRVRAVQKKLNLTVHCTTALPRQIVCDEARLRQILINLLGNAVKFTEAGEVKVTLTAEDDASALRIEVADTGIGMSSEVMQRLFQPFTQGDSSTSRRYGGTGLGLTITKRIIEKMGGRIYVRSEAGQGSTFALTLPLGSVAGADMDAVAATPTPRTPAPAMAAAMGDRPLAGMHILLAEDGPDNQRLIDLLLRKAGAEVTLANDGREAIAKALSHPIDVILMDIQMPEVDGYQATAALREAGFTNPIIALTAHALAEDRQRCLQAGCCDYLSKPIDRARLIGLVTTYAHQARAASGLA